MNNHNTGINTNKIEEKNCKKNESNKYNVLSYEDIEALLEIVEEETFFSNNLLEGTANTPEQQIILYDFKRPNKISKEELKAIRILFDNISKEIKTKIKNILENENIEVTLHSVDQLLYTEFLMSLPSPTSFNVIFINNNLSFIVEINPSLIFSYIEKYIGKKIYENYSYQHLNSKDLIFIKELNNLIIESIQNIIKEEINEKLVINKVEHLLSPNMKNITYMEDIVVVIAIKVIIGDISSFINLCFPYDIFKNIFEKIKYKYFPSPKKSNKINSKIKDKLIKDLVLDIKIGYKTKLNLKDLLKLKPDDVIAINDKNLYLFIKDKFKIKLKDNR